MSAEVNIFILKLRLWSVTNILEMSLVSGDGVWDINSTSGDVFVKARSLLLPEKSTFAFNVTVTDGAYNITVLLNIVVNSQ